VVHQTEYMRFSTVFSTDELHVRTGCKPPGGLVLAQLQSGNLHLDESQEYPAAAALEVGPEITPSS